MDSRNKDAIQRFHETEAREYARYSGKPLNEVKQLLSTVDAANSHRHEIKDSWDGNADERSGCGLLLLVLPCVGYLLLYGGRLLFS